MLSSLILPSNPIGFLVFRTFTFGCQNQILNLLGVLKIAHYMKVTQFYLKYFIFCKIKN